MFIAWHVEAFHRTKSLPAFDTLIEREMGRQNPGDRPQSPDEQKQIMRAYSAAMRAGT